MCGISGEYRFDGSVADVRAVDTMARAVANRGPDGSGAWQDGPIAFGHRRLTIIDLSERGAQPMVDTELGLTIVFNGCIYNYRQLREELIGHGYRFFSESDTEVVLKAFHHWGRDFVDHLLGMFAFALYVADSRRLILARDRLGIKPLYLSRTGSRLRFASTLPALVAAGDIDTSIDRVALQQYMTFHSVVPAPRTILNGVEKLPPATVRTVEADGTTTDRRYWAPSYSRPANATGLTAFDWQERLLDSLRTAVERRMVADVPVGVLLSGGIDSSLVVALLAEAGQKDLKTFSIGFEAVADREGDEFHWSDIVAKEFATEHSQIRIDSAALFPAVAEAVAAMSEPMVSHDVVAFYLLSKEVSQHVKVVQSGQGADEVLAGYDWYPPFADLSPKAALSTYQRVFFDRRHDEMGGVLSPEWMLDADEATGFVAEHFSRPGAETALDRALRLDTEIMLVDDPVKRVDNMTMRWGLEARVPFLDHEFVELAASCPPELKLAHNGKGVLKDAARAVLPAEVIDRKKGYFPVPAVIVLEAEHLDRVRDVLTDPVATSRGLFRPETVQQLLAAPNDTRTTLGSNALWQLALIEMWLQEHDVG